MRLRGEETQGAKCPGGAPGLRGYAFPAGVIHPLAARGSEVEPHGDRGTGRSGSRLRRRVGLTSRVILGNLVGQLPKNRGRLKTESEAPP